MLPYSGTETDSDKQESALTSFEAITEDGLETRDRFSQTESLRQFVESAQSQSKQWKSVQKQFKFRQEDVKARRNKSHEASIFPSVHHENIPTLKNITPSSKKFSENWLLHVIIFLTVSVLPSNWFLQ